MHPEYSKHQVFITINSVLYCDLSAVARSFTQQKSFYVNGP